MWLNRTWFKVGDGAPVCVHRAPRVYALHTDVTKAEVAAGMLPMLCACAGERETVLARTERHDKRAPRGSKGYKMHLARKCILKKLSLSVHSIILNATSIADLGQTGKQTASVSLFLCSEKKDFLCITSNFLLHKFL